MSDVKRYDYGYKDDGCGGARYLGLIEKPDGALVRHSDYAALEAECDKLRAQVSALQSDANSWQSGYDKGREDGAKAADGWKAQHARDSAELRRLCAERDALRAEAESLRVALLEIASANPAERGIEWAKSYASDGLKGAGSELYARWLDTFKEAEALRAENGRLQADRDRANQYANQQALECNKLSTDLEAARGLLRESRKSYTEAIHWEDQQPVMKKIDAFLTAFPVPEVRCQTCDGTGDVHRSDGEWLGECHCVKTEQGERQEAVAEVVQREPYEDGTPNPCKTLAWSLDNCEDDLPTGTKLYTTPQPGPDVRSLVEALEWYEQQASGCRKLTSEGDKCRQALDSDGGKRAQTALAAVADALAQRYPKPSLLKDCNVSYSNSSRPLAEQGERQETNQDVRGLVSADDVRDACANAVSVFTEVANADQCREVAEYMREVLLAQIARRQAQRQA